MDMNQAPLMDAPRSPSMEEDEPMQGVLEDGPIRVVRRGDSAVVDFAPGADRVSIDDSDEHICNLAEGMDDTERNRLVNLVIEQVDADLASRAPWEERVDQAMQLLGIQNRPLDDLPFVGASAVTYPLIGEACVQFQARAIEEVFPSDGPCKTKIVGKRTREREEQADRVNGHMNYQMMEEDRAYFWHVDQMLFLLPVFGSAFKKTYFDAPQDMVVSRLVPPGDFIVPYLATDLYTSPRYTHRMVKVRAQMERLIESGYYRDVELFKTDSLMHTDAGSSKDMLDVADDRTPVVHEDDDSFTLYEMHCDLSLTEDQLRYLGVSDDPSCDIDGYPLPYVVTVEKETRQLMSVRRNWKEGDERYKRRQWFTHYKYLPGLGFYGFGLLHLIGSLSESATGALRALLDGAAFANMQGGFVSDDAQIPEGQNHIEPGVYKRVKMSAEELARSFYSPNFKEPSPALQNLFGLLVDAGRRFSSTTEEMTGEASNTGPVGTTIALIEQGSKVFSGVHRRLHVAQAEELALRAELNGEFLPEEYPYEVEGESRYIMRADYDARVDVVPVSDPNIFSSAQRIAQGQAILELAERFPGEIDLTEAVKRFLKAIKVPDYEMLLKNGDKMRRDPVGENMLLMVGRPAKAFVEQDHDSHIAVHMALLGSINDEARQIVGPAMQAHLAEHYAYKYYNEMNAQLGGQLPPPTWMDGDSEEDEEMQDEVDAMISHYAAQAQVPQIMPPTEDGPSAKQQEQMAQAQAAQAKAQADAQMAADRHAQEQDQRERAWQAEEDRKQAAFEAEQDRKDLAVGDEMDRRLAMASTEEERKAFAHEQEMARKKVEARQAARGSK